MPSALPLILAAGAAAVLLGKKKKKTTDGAGVEPDSAPGTGMDDDELDNQLNVVLRATKATPPPSGQSILFAQRATIPAEIQDVAQEVDEGQNVDPPTKAPESRCAKGTTSSDKRRVCWWQKGAKGGWGEPKFHRVVKYKTARAAASAAVLNPLHVLQITSPGYNFAMFCWLNRKRLYKCAKKRRGKCKKWERY